MNSPAITRSPAEEINRLHSEAVKLAAASRQSLDAALMAAWRAGALLIDEKKRVRRTMGAGAWLIWLESNFRGTPRTAQRYMRLARSVSDPGFVQGLSLRQAYERLGIATEPKRRGQPAPGRLAPHVSLATRLVRTLRSPKVCAQMTPERRKAYQADLRMLYDRLRLLFENQPVNNFTATVSNLRQP
jgi:hypothetical protein